MSLTVFSKDQLFMWLGVEGCRENQKILVSLTLLLAGVIFKFCRYKANSLSQRIS